MITVLGAGVAGLCAATALSEAGHAVTVVDDERTVPVSRMAGGMLAPFCESDGAPAEVTARGQSAVDWWAARVPGVARRGTLVVATTRDSGEFTRFARATTGHATVDPATLEADLAGRFRRALFFADEGHLDPVDALAALRQSLLDRGVTFRARGPISGSRVVDCRGWAARDALPDLRAVRGETILLHAPDVRLTRPVRLLHPRFPCYIVPRGGHHYMVGATMVETARNGGITLRSAAELMSAAHTVHPGFAEAEVTGMAAGLRPAFPDNLPALRFDGARVHLNGLYRHGFLLAPALAADLVQHFAKERADAH
ncbi:MAG: FAD-dependent oxidoreductase [Pseudooceanicola sp.]|jgi:glycine oxidase|nr:FAD-dependent oxidoreductase [Pseudooceanicola sp.]